RSARLAHVRAPVPLVDARLKVDRLSGERRSGVDDRPVEPGVLVVEDIVDLVVVDPVRLAGRRSVTHAVQRSLRAIQVIERLDQLKRWRNSRTTEAVRRLEPLRSRNRLQREEVRMAYSHRIVTSEDHL